MRSPLETLKSQAQAARKASRTLAASTTDARNGALIALAASLEDRQGEVLAANKKDLAAAKRSGLDEHVVERMSLNAQRIAGIAQSVRDVALLPDPVGEIIEYRLLPNGLRLERRRVPLGVIGVIYESRPNVTVDIAALCLKSGNACILRGGKEAFETNSKLARIAQEAIAESGLPAGAVQFVASTDRSLVGDMLQMKDEIDLMIPRGGAELVRMVAREAKMPAITGGVGVCHTYVDAAADLANALSIVHNAKTSRPTVCNALDTVIVHSAIAERFLPMLAQAFAASGVEMRCDRRSLSVLGAGAVEGTKGKRVRNATTTAVGAPVIKLAAPGDFGQEFLSLVASIAVVDSLDDALDFIARHGSGHSEAIVTEDIAAAERFLNEVDAAAVFANASTRFNDGGEFALGAEVAISTNKFHARGPMGLREITSYKWVIRGDGQIRK
ncbi:MAG: glutamate-5-semialdehyde dehydrogenase [Dehalococcoidia bacterium]|nr:glutamate-5-semialdehyde dehydrogenase [Dehalococcoidia bacterium]